MPSADSYVALATSGNYRPRGSVEAKASATRSATLDRARRRALSDGTTAADWIPGGDRNGIIASRTCPPWSAARSAMLGWNEQCTAPRHTAATRPWVLSRRRRSPVLRHQHRAPHWLRPSWPGGGGRDESAPRPGRYVVREHTDECLVANHVVADGFHLLARAARDAKIRR